MKYSQKSKTQRNANRRERQLRNINLLGGRCRICNASEKLEVHHRWYTSADKGTHGEHDSMKNLIEMEPKRFACLCHRCNVLVGHIYKNKVNKTYDILIDEAEKMMEGRKNYSDDILTQRHALKRQIKCAVCEKIMSVNGRHLKKFCSSECKLADRRKNKKVQQHQTLKILNCVTCSETFQITTGKQITCSPKCRMRRAEEIKTQQNLQQKETRLKNINRLGSRCRICNAVEKLEVHHRWYTDEDRAMRSNHINIESCIKKQPERFACLCHMCNVIAGGVYRNMKNDTFDILTDEVRRMIKGRKNKKILTQYMNVPIRQVKCIVCNTKTNARGKQSKKFCSKECKREYRRTTQNKKYKQLNPPKILSCVVCAEEFTQTTGGQKSCSKKCADMRTRELKREYERRHRLPKFGVCVTCGNEFQRKDGRATCSGKCDLSHKRKMAIKERKYARRRYEQSYSPTLLACVVCGNEFQRKAGPKKTCSVKCKQELAKQRYLKKHPPVFSKCVICDNTFKRNGPHKTCSIKCHKVHVRSYMRKYARNHSKHQS